MSKATHHLNPLRKTRVELPEQLQSGERVRVCVERGRVEVGEHPRDLGEVGDGVAEEGGHAAASLQVVVSLKEMFQGGCRQCYYGTYILNS